MISDFSLSLAVACPTFCSPDRQIARSPDRLLADDEGLHQITTIKRQPRDFTYQQLVREIERGQQLRTQFALAERAITQIELSAESVRYYASLVQFYTVYKLKRMDREVVHLYLL